MSGEVLLRARGLRAGYAARGGRLEVLGGVDLEVRRGELLAIVGPSGCGKSTLLSLLAGLMAPGAGAIERGGARVATVFQRPTLLPWRTVLSNVTFGLECRGPVGAAERAQAAALLERLGLGAHLEDRPHALSEGMKQRVNLARALAVAPDVLLMDEPFAALDALTRRGLQDDLLARWGQGGLTVVLVSHDLAEVAYLADRAVGLSEKPATIIGEQAVTLPRPRGTDAAGRLALFEVAEALERRLIRGRG